MAARKSPAKGEEPPQALRAFEDYYGMGEGRSLPKLAKQYRASAEAVPTKQATRLKLWSAAHKWQQRVKDRDQATTQARAKQVAERAMKFRERVLVGIEVDVNRYLQALQNRGSEGIMAEDAASLERLVVLFFKLAEQPLTDKQQVEHSGPGGGPLQTENKHSGILALSASAEVLGILAAAGALEPAAAGAADPEADDVDTAPAAP